MLPKGFGRYKSKHRLFSVQIPEHKKLAHIPHLPSLSSHEINLKKMRRMQSEQEGGDRRNGRRPGEWRPLHPLLSHPLHSITKLLTHQTADETTMSANHVTSNHTALTSTSHRDPRN